MTADMPRYRIPDDVLLDAACEIFATVGFEQATMDEIASRAGATKPTLYARFGSKQELFDAALRREYELMLAHLSGAYDSASDEPFRARLQRWVDAYFDFTRARPIGFQLRLQGEQRPGSSLITQQSRTEIVDRLSELVIRTSRRDLGPGARLTAAAIAGMMNWAAREAVNIGADLTEAAALCGSMQYSAMINLDLDLVAAARTSTTGA